MKDRKVFVGLDYDQASVQLCVLAWNGRALGNRSLPNEAAVLLPVAEQFGELADVVRVGYLPRVWRTPVWFSPAPASFGRRSWKPPSV